MVGKDESKQSIQRDIFHYNVYPPNIICSGFDGRRFVLRYSVFVGFVLISRILRFFFLIPIMFVGGRNCVQIDFNRLFSIRP